MSSEHFELHGNIETEIKAIDWLAANTDLTRQTIKQAMINGSVWLTTHKIPRRLRRAKKILEPGQKLSLYFDKTIQQSQISEPTLIADKHHYSVWFKPYGCYSQGTKWGDHMTLQRWVEMHHQPQRSCFIVHRLDRATSGLMLLAHTKKAATKLSALFAKRELRKIYHAIVEGRFPETEQIYNQDIDSKPALSHANLIEANANHSLVSIEIHSGRKHQIRRHLSSGDFPILGDRLYGHAQDSDIDLQLMSTELSFECPFDKIQKHFQVPKEMRLRLKSPSQNKPV